MEYRSKYRCRLCGEVYTGEEATGRELAVSRIYLKASENSHNALMSPYNRNVHSCADGGLGLSDFCGFELTEEAQT